MVEEGGGEGGERETSPLLPSLRSAKWLEEEEEVLVLEGAGGGGVGVEVKVGSDVEMLFSDGVWYRGWISKWLGDGKKDDSKDSKVAVSKVAVIDFQDGDRQKVELPHPEVRPLQPDAKDPEREEEDLYPVGARVEMLFDDGVWYRGRIQTRNGNRGLIVFDDGDRRRTVFPDPEVRRIFANGRRAGVGAAGAAGGGAGCGNGVPVNAQKSVYRGVVWQIYCGTDF